MRTADIILEQLGGNRFVAMTGSSHFISDGNTLRMHLAKNGSKANRDVYCDQLQELFTEVTKLYTHF